ncbi:MAG TPA: GDP-mannose 4,6-dehydratase, partial [Terrimesophilobacter sp.]|nr:GDP-mannose 4,6-dehydratase [Terrimesophilobacter sp.]
MNSVITGGAGFIGSHLAEYLLGQGDNVVVLDDLSTGSLLNLAPVADSPRLTFVRGSILDRDLVYGLIAASERVFHLAAAVGVKLIVEEPLSSLRTNIHGTENVLDAALSAGARLLIASTSEVYGKNTADRL